MQCPSVPGPSSQAPERATREDENAVRDAGPHGQSKAAHRPRVVMIVDDHAHFGCAMRHWIAGLHADFELVEAASGEEAVAPASRQEVHIALMDIELPGMNGLEVTRRIKEMRPDIAVIVVSQHSADAYVERARAAGAFAYITKDKVGQELFPVIGRARHRGGQGDPR